jgi:hypothetical protein
VDLKQPFSLSRASCTDINWHSPSCPAVCINCKSQQQVKPDEITMAQLYID